MRSLLVASVLLGAGWPAAQAADIGPIQTFDTKEAGTTLSADGRTATTSSFTVSAIPHAADQHSPHCATARFDTPLGSLNQRGRSNCIRICAALPQGYELDRSRPFDAKVPHAWSAAFNPEYYTAVKRGTADGMTLPGYDNKACMTFKNWSDDTKIDVVLAVPVCKTGECPPAAPPPAATATRPEPVRLPERMPGIGGRQPPV